MNIIEAKPVIVSLLRSQIPIYTHGAPGIGKSELHKQIADEMFDGHIIDVRASQYESIDFRGLPKITGNMTEWTLPSILPYAHRDGDRGLLYLDELSGAQMATQVVLLQLINDKRIGDYVLPAGWSIAASGNRRQDKSGVQAMSRALGNRFAHIDLEPHLESALNHWLTVGVMPEICAFVKFRPQLLHNMDGDDIRFPSPRSWVRLSHAIANEPDATLHYQLARALVGDAAAAEFRGFLEVWKTLPSMQAILNDPLGAALPASTSPATMYALAAGISRAMTYATFRTFNAYLGRLPVEFSVMAVTDALKRDLKLRVAPGFTDWALANQDVMH